MADERSEDDRLFVRDGWRHYRRTYSLGEVRWGVACFAAMLLITGWVIWKGRHPDPNLFGDSATLLEAAKPGAAPPVASAPPAVGAPAAAPAAPPAATTLRGPLPAGLGGADWNEDKVAEFDEENLYVKIDGRADYFRAFHFRRLYSVLLTSKKEAAATIDVEMYDLFTGPNALGAYSGERPPNAKVIVSDAGLHHFDRNALYLARGRYYIRVIGSDETPVISAKLQQIAEVMLKEVQGEPLPWAYGLYIGEMGIGADKITYSAKNAFSLAFADDVWAVRPNGKETDLELFVSARANPPAAKKLAGSLGKAFLELGGPAGKAGGVALVKDQFLGLFSGVKTVNRFVIGVRGAESKDAAVAELARLEKAIAGAPAELVARAQPAGESAGAPAADAPESPAKTSPPPAKGAEVVDEL